MPSPAPLRLVVSRAEAPEVATSPAAIRLAPPAPAIADKAMIVAAGASFAMHAAVLLWIAINGVFGEERAAGVADDLVLIEGIAVELVAAAPMPEAAPVEAASEPEAPVEETPPPEPAEEATKPIEPPPPEPPPPATAEPAEDVLPLPAPETLPPPEAETGELAARPEAAEPPPAEAPPPEEPARSEPEEEGPPPPDPETVPTPRAKPERTEVAAAEPPPEDPETPKEPPRSEPAKPAAPPPSAPSAAQSAARSGGAGGGGASQTTGNAAASAYRAKVAAQLKRKRFYPNAARRDRLTGTATVSFTLNAGGKVTAARVVRSSGERILDEAAVEMVRRASPYPPIPAGLGATITIQAPIGFELPR